MGLQGLPEGNVIKIKNYGRDVVMALDECHIFINKKYFILSQI